MEQIYNILLHDGCDQTAFLNEVSDGDHCHCVNECEYIPNNLVMKMDETHANELKNHPFVKEIKREETPVPASLPDFFSKTRTFTGVMPNVSLDPRDFGPLQFYYFNDQLNSNGLTIGSHRWTGTPQPPNDDSASIFGTYSSCWTGKNVDIVTLEVNIPKNTEALKDGDPHPDFIKLGTESTIKVIPTNWPGLSNSDNTNQTGSTNTSILSAHAIGVLSAAAGTYCGYAKKSNLYVTYIESVLSNVNSIISWHNSKSINPETGVKNPTILIHEYQYLYGNFSAFKIEDIKEFTYFNSSTQSMQTFSRPAEGWGNDLTPFVSRNFNIKRILKNGLYHWCVVVGAGTDTFILDAIKSAYDNGIINIVPAGNDASTYVKTNDPNYDSIITVQAGATYFNIVRSESYGYITVSSPLPYDIQKYSFRPYGPHGSIYGIDVAAAQNSERYPIIDYYSARGPGVDILGMGRNTYTAYPLTLYPGGKLWGMFSGTSCASPTVAGILACLLERYYYYHGQWPNPMQAKEILLSEAKRNILSNTTATTWSNVPSPSTVIRGKEIAIGAVNLMLLYDSVSLNGGIANTELLGTPNVRAFINNTINKDINLQGSRPNQGQVYPRQKIKIG